MNLIGAPGIIHRPGVFISVPLRRCVISALEPPRSRAFVTNPITTQSSEPSATPHSSPRLQIALRVVAGCAALLVLLGLFAWILRYDLRGYAVLMRFTDPAASGPLVRWKMQPFATTDVKIPFAGEDIVARIYFPVGAKHPPGILLVHGIHHLAIDDPRFVNLANALAGAGIAVLAPTMEALSDYHVESNTIAKIGNSAQWLAKRLGRTSVTVMGISFSGGLALLAAADPQYQPYVHAVVSVGGYDDLARVSRFLATSEEELPNGGTAHLPAHDYGAAVFVYGHLPQFFAVEDLPTAREALRYYLWEQPEKASPFLPSLTASGRETMEILLARDIARLRPRLLAAISADQEELAALSPHGHIAGLRAPIFLLHGSEDSVIPPAESLWLAKDIPPEALRAVLITPMFSHVDLKASAVWRDELRLVHFMGSVLRAVD